jgi:hypothetical protein
VPRRTTPLAVLTSLLAATAVAGSTAPNDAGSGGDAGDTRDQALLLPSPGSYNGRLDVAGDADWYRVAQGSSPAICLETWFRGGLRADAVAAIAQDPALTARHPMSGNKWRGIGLASPGGGDGMAAVEPSFSSGQQPDTGPYSFSLSVGTEAAPQRRETPTGADAGDLPASASNLPGPCFAGQVGGLGDGSDHFRFTGRDGEVLSLSFAQGGGATATLDLLAPDGRVLASLRSGGFARVWLDTQGTWMLRVTADAAGSESGMDEPASPLPRSDTGEDDYLVGASTESTESDPNPCRPLCGSSVELT